MAALASAHSNGARKGAPPRESITAEGAEKNRKERTGRTGRPAKAWRIDDYRAKGDDPVPLLYQTGYLTIKDCEPRTGRYTLGFPNEEVKYAFLGELLDSYVPKGSNLKRLF
ncbi:MAG: hypothetical protein LBT74_07690, partial [Acidobacteriota bacterium]|nr:hypothetical protein [Acidobacteriota bacterium]